MIELYMWIKVDQWLFYGSATFTTIAQQFGHFVVRSKERRAGDAGVTGFARGDEVMAMVVNVGSHGAYRDSIVLRADCVVRTPAGRTLIEAATLPMNGLTARGAH